MVFSGVHRKTGEYDEVRGLLPIITSHFMIFNLHKCKQKQGSCCENYLSLNAKITNKMSFLIMVSLVKCRLKNDLPNDNHIFPKLSKSAVNQCFGKNWSVAKHPNFFLSFSIYCQTLFRVLSAGVLCTLRVHFVHFDAILISVQSFILRKWHWLS